MAGVCRLRMCALLLVLVIANWRSITLVFPIWMLLVSTDFFLAELRLDQAQTSGVATHQVKETPQLTGQ